MQPKPQTPGPVPFPVPLLTPSQLRSPGGDLDRWLWHGYLGARLITAFVSRGKSGKTTLASVLLSMLKRGGQLGGLAVAAGKAVGGRICVVYGGGRDRRAQGHPHCCGLFPCLLWRRRWRGSSLPPPRLT
jgi:hypothetical protein